MSKYAIDCRWIFKDISGIGRYTQELVTNLMLVDMDNEYLLLFDNKEVLDRTLQVPELQEAESLDTCLLDYGLFSPKNQLKLPGLLEEKGVQVYHSTNYMTLLTGLRKRGIASIVTIHDLIPVLFPDHAPKSRKSRIFPVFKQLMKQIPRSVDHIITPSESTRSDVLRLLSAPAGEQDRVSAIPEAAAPEYKPPSPGSVRRKEILYVGRFDPYKNVPVLIEAFSRLRSAHPDLRLRLVGREDERYPEARQWAARLGVEDAIDWQGYVTPTELIEAYQQAAVMVVPSRCEGFGLTVLEAMSCGAPVICSNVSSLPEVAGEAALLIDPDDASGLQTALGKVLDDTALAEKLARLGPERAREFNWVRTAISTLNCYRQAETLYS